MGDAIQAKNHCRMFKYYKTYCHFVLHVVYNVQSDWMPRDLKAHYVNTD